MSKITTLIAAAALLTSGAAMAQSKDFNSMVVDYGQAPGLSAKAEAGQVAAQPAAKTVVAQASVSNADAELGFFVPANRKAAPAATLLAKNVR